MIRPFNLTIQTTKVVNYKQYRMWEYILLEFYFGKNMVEFCID